MTELRRCKFKVHTTGLAGYWGALTQGIKDKIICYSLHLKADGKYKLNKIKPSALFAAWNTFQAALAVWKFRQANGLTEE